MEPFKDKNINAILDCPGNEVVELTNDNEHKYIITKRNHKFPTNKVIILAIVCIAIVTLFSTVFAIANTSNDKILKGISIKGIDVSNLTQEEAISKVNAYIETLLNRDITLVYEEFEKTINPNQIEAGYDVENAVKEAYNIGRNGNIVSNNYTIVFSNFSKKDLPVNITYNQELLSKVVEDIHGRIPGKVEQAAYSIEDEELIITKGKSGLSIKKEELEKLIINSIQSDSNDKIGIPVENVQPDAIDIDKIYNEVYKEAKDAYYTSDPFEIHTHVVGVDFKNSLEEVKEMLKEDKEEYTIELKYTQPKVTTDKIGTEAFPDLLSSFSTTYITSKVNRTTNLKLAAAKINGHIVMPGETFSYNKVVGKRTVEAGYKEAGVYSGGEVVDGLGGGICQISSNLYDLVLYANLDIVERHNHQFLPGYVGAGKDATVVYGALDFKFKNTRKYPIKIQASVGGGYVRMKLYGTKEDVEYDVSIQSTILQTIYPKTVYKDTSTLPEGKTKVQDSGQNGCKSKTYKILKKDGKVISKTLLSTDTYDAMKKVVLRGTKKSSSSGGSSNTNTNTNTNNNTTNENNTNVPQNNTSTGENNSTQTPPTNTNESNPN